MNSTNSLTHQTNGSEWIYYIHNSSDFDWSLKISSSKPTYYPDSFYTVYLTNGLDKSPNQFSYDMIFKNRSSEANLTLNGNVVPSNQFTLAIFVNGYDQYNNKANFLDVTIDPTQKPTLIKMNTFASVHSAQNHVLIIVLSSVCILLVVALLYVIKNRKDEQVEPETERVQYATLNSA